MNRPVIIVAPVSSGKTLAPLFKQKNIPCIAISNQTAIEKGFNSEINTNDFVKVIPHQKNLSKILKPYQPRAIIAGSEGGVEIAEKLSLELTPSLANSKEKLLHRRHKALMQEALSDAGLPSLLTLSTSSEYEAEKWIWQHHLDKSDLILKPPSSAGSDNIFHISEGCSWNEAFHQILSSHSKLTGIKNNEVIIQEHASGTEYALGTVSAHGRHYLSHIIKYHKGVFNGRSAMYDFVEFVPLDDKTKEVWQFSQDALDALGIRFGATHTEIMLTEKGPQLIEIGARMCGGPVVEFSQLATGSNQAQKLVEIYTAGALLNQHYSFKQCVVPVFIRAKNEGVIKNLEALSQARKLPTYYKDYIWYKNGDSVPKTIDYLTNLGIIALSGHRKAIMRDYEVIRELEKGLMACKPMGLS